MIAGMRSGKLGAALLAASPAITVIAAVAACSSFDDAADDAANGDGGPEASADSASTTEDAATATDAADEVPASHCDATFCSGFDEDPYDTGWQRLDDIDAGMGATNETPRSPPRALRAQVDPGMHDGELQLRRVFAGRYKSARFAFVVRVGKAPAGAAGYQLASIGWGGPRPGSSTDRVSEMQIVIEGMSLLPKHDEDMLADASPASDFGETFGYATGRWYPVEIALTFDAGKKVKAVATIDGQVLYDKTFTSNGEPAELDVEVGLPGIFTTITSTGLTDIDDVRVWLEPE